MKLFFFFFAITIITTAQDSKKHVSEEHNFKVETLFQGQDVIWGFDFLNPNEIVFTERSGKIGLLNLKNKNAFYLEGAPSVYAESQGGMLDISTIPNSEGKKILFCYSHPNGNKATTAVASARIEGKKLKDFKRIFEAVAWSSNSIHFGCRITWESSEIFYLSVGDRNERKKAQKLDSHNGKILRLSLEGKAAKGNPFENTPNALPEIWSYGHRNPQGLVMDAKKNLLEAEFGPRGGDEINLIQKSLNYGWPVVTYGKEYWGPKIGEGSHKAGMEQPLIHWVPSISPSGISFYSGNLFPKWKGNLFIANLSGSHLRRIVFDEKFKVQKQEVLLDSLFWRFRDVQSGPDGKIYISTDHGTLAALSLVK